MSTSRNSSSRGWSSVDAPSAAATRPDGRVDLIQQSHERCTALGLTRIERPDYEPLMRSDLSIARERNQRLFAHAAPVMEMLYEQIVNTESMVVLCDSSGTIIHSIGDDDFLARAAHAIGAAAVVVGHHADDQAETILLHLLRGAGQEVVTSGAGGGLQRQAGWAECVAHSDTFADVAQAADGRLLRHRRRIIGRGWPQAVVEVSDNEPLGRGEASQHVEQGQ